MQSKPSLSHEGVFLCKRESMIVSRVPLCKHSLRIFGDGPLWPGD